MTPIHEITLAPGATVRFSQTVGESDVCLFAGITGDLSPNHDAAFMANTP
jgi:3-hydroxybutyryl-CoA dehydratase